MKVNLKQMSEKFKSAKNHVFTKAAAAKLYNDIRRYFAKYLEISLFIVIAESIISQYCFCQQPY